MTAPLVDDPTASDHGMVIDFGDVKSLLGDMIDGLDHGFMVWDQDPIHAMLQSTKTKVIVVSFVPTAENIAQLLLERSAILLQQKGITVLRVKVWETPNCIAEAVVE